MVLGKRLRSGRRYDVSFKTTGFFTSEQPCALCKIFNLLLREYPVHNDAVLTLFEALSGLLESFGADLSVVNPSPVSEWFVAPHDSYL